MVSNSTLSTSESLLKKSDEAKGEAQLDRFVSESWIDGTAPRVGVDILHAGLQGPLKKLCWTEDDSDTEVREGACDAEMGEVAQEVGV